MIRPDYHSAVRFCPCCGHSVEQKESIVIEYWQGEHNVCFTWCHVCGWRGEITEIKRVTTTEIPE
ncbi:hypothetical protein [Ammoniphilus sp. YIM 78166]|uniref:hypothetical protein n=1 Tax=Ammoniphilus sp. YIM 78166 TaxID=1644106 RepID=UPI0014305F94|nr:hypothetical protein [Ammoniphilus sp. YIM 78166]